MSNPSSRFIANQLERNPNYQNESRANPANVRLHDNNHRLGRLNRTPYSCSQSSFNTSNQNKQQNNRDASSQDSRQGTSFYEMIKSTVFGLFQKSSQTQSQQSQIPSESQTLKLARASNLQDPDAQDDDDNLSAIELEQYDQIYDLQWDQRHKDNRQKGNFSFQQTPMSGNSVVQSKRDKAVNHNINEKAIIQSHLQPRIKNQDSNFHSVNQNYQYPRVNQQQQHTQNQVMSSQQSAKSQLQMSDKKKPQDVQMLTQQMSQQSLNNQSSMLGSSINSQGPSNSQTLSMWSKYNINAYKNCPIIMNSTKKNTLKCIKLIALKVPKKLITSDNRQDLIMKIPRDQNYLVFNPKVKKLSRPPLNFVHGPIGTIYDDFELQSMNHYLADNLLKNQIAQRRKRSYDNTTNETGSIVEMPSNYHNPRMQRAKLDDSGDHLMQSQTIKYQDAASKDIQIKKVSRFMNQKEMNRFEKEYQNISKIQDDMKREIAIKDLYCSFSQIIDKKLKEQEKDKNKKYLTNQAKSGYNDGVKPSEIYDIQQRIADQQKQEMKSFVQECLKQFENKIISEYKKDIQEVKESQFQSQQSMKEELHSSQQNLCAPEYLDQIKEMIKQSQKNIEELLIQNKDVSQQISKMNSNEKLSDRSYSLKELCSDSPSKKDIVKFNADIKAQQSVSTDNKNTTSFQFKPLSSTNVKTLEIQHKPLNESSPSFGDKSDNTIKNQDSFVSENISSNDPSSPKENAQTKPPNISTDTNQQDVQPKFQFKINVVPSTNNVTSNQASANVKANESGQNQAVISTTSSNPFLKNQVSSNTTNTTTTTTTTANPFLQPKAASNPFLSGAGSATPAVVTTPGFSSNTNNSTGAAIQSQFKSPFAANNSQTPQNNFNSQTQSSTPAQNNPFVQNNNSNTSSGANFQSSSGGMNNPFNQNKSGASNNFTMNNNSSSGSGNNFQTSFNTNPFANKQGSGGSNQPSNSFQSNSNGNNPFAANKPTTQPFNNATNFQSASNGSNPFASNSGGSNNFNINPNNNNNIQRSSFNAGGSGSGAGGSNPFISNNQNQKPNNPFSSNTPGGGNFNSGGNPFNSGNSNFSQNNNSGGAGSFALGKKVTGNNKSNDADDDLFADRKIFKAKRNY
ncbi:UNKNOWN [Stylonychia lemnae]|uniref:Uncharacterized protein n=1 Tax=Stylonychia lemnae TaxID=5949 RepID=A0A078A3K2_STYLE|nr:UNKNOWN [Stylonychia lemnae]|eukprot:CDW76387.1 UNKNOWN [Stylonychia lemnae]